MVVPGSARWAAVSSPSSNSARSAAVSTKRQRLGTLVGPQNYAAAHRADLAVGTWAPKAFGPASQSALTKRERPGKKHGLFDPANFRVDLLNPSLRIALSPA